MQIPITKPCLGHEEEVAASEAIRSGWLSQGPRVKLFEDAIAAYCQTEYAVAVSSCTTAMHLSLLALGIGPGDEVICPSMSFIATANAIAYTGAKPVFAEVDCRYCIDPDDVQTLITDRTKAILVVHQIGLPVELDIFLDIGKQHGLSILEDAACAMGSKYKGVPIGGHSEMASFSFHPRKILTTGEGGVVTTNDAAHAKKLRLLRHHGMSVPDTVRHESKSIITEQYSVLGYNYRMTDVQAAIGIEQMKRLDHIVDRRRRLAEVYHAAFRDHPYLEVVEEPAWATWNYQSYPLLLREESPVSRDSLMQYMLDRGIATRRGVMLSHREPVYRDQPFRHDLDHSRAMSDRTLLVPLYPDLSESEQTRVIEELKSAFVS